MGQGTQPDLALDCGDGLRIEFTWIAAGRFLMGSDRGLELERPVHPVEIARAFLLGTYPVTQAEWRAVMGANPSEFPGDRRPVENISWEDTQAFCRSLARRTGRRVRLPTEAEWEYACRAGTTTEYFFGDDPAPLPDYAWFDVNSGEGTSPVGVRRPNPWGLHDLLGNVWEWCEDVWRGDYEGAPADGRARSDGEGQPRRVLRGGSWNYDAFRCRSAYRSREWKDFATNHFGLRVMLEDYMTEGTAAGS